MLSSVVKEELLNQTLDAAKIEAGIREMSKEEQHMESEEGVEESKQQKKLMPKAPAKT